MSQLDHLSALLVDHCVAVDQNGQPVEVDEDWVPVLRRENKASGEDEKARPGLGTFVRALKGGGSLRVESIIMRKGGFETKSLDLESGNPVLDQLLKAAKLLRQVTSQTA